MRSFRWLLFMVLMIFSINNTFADFRDVSGGHENAGAILYVQEHGIVSGYADGTFKPDQSINRAEFTKIIVGAVVGGEPDASMMTPNCFSDVREDAWFHSYVCYAKSMKIIGGYPDGTFKPTQNITFVEAAKIIAEAFHPGEVLGSIYATSGPWFAPYVISMSLDMAIPMSVSFYDEDITRGEMSEMVYRLKAGITNKPSRSDDDLTFKGLQTNQHGWQRYENADLAVAFEFPSYWYPNGSPFPEASRSEPGEYEFVSGDSFYFGELNISLGDFSEILPLLTSDASTTVQNIVDELDHQFNGLLDVEVQTILGGRLVIFTVSEYLADSIAILVREDDPKASIIFGVSYMSTAADNPQEVFDRIVQSIEVLPRGEVTEYSEMPSPAVSPTEVVLSYARHTLGMIPGADFDLAKAKMYVTAGLASQMDADSFIPTSYGFQDGPDDVIVIKEIIRTAEEATVTLKGSFGGSTVTWDFELVRNPQNEWKISGYQQK